MRLNSFHFDAAACDSSVKRTARFLSRLAVRSLYTELSLYPKPGLVSRKDNGAHKDMDASSFMRSLFRLRHYFHAVARAGAEKQAFSELRRLGVRAEADMLQATAGANTHRGAIFSLGLLTAAAGAVITGGDEPRDQQLRDVIAEHWKRDLLLYDLKPGMVPSHGQQVAARYRVGGARSEAGLGFPSVFELGLPALRHALSLGVEREAALLHAFFTLLSRVADTNVLYRGGTGALAWLQRTAAGFLSQGSVWMPDWRAKAEAVHHSCSRRGLSPGGCADLLACVWFVHQLQSSYVHSAQFAA